MKPGDIVLTGKGGSLFAKAIIAFLSLWGNGEVSDVYHAMRYLGNDDSGTPLFMSQELTARIKPVTAWAGKQLRIWSNPAYRPEDRVRLVKESRSVEGRRYDWLGIIGQACRAIPLVGQWFPPLIEAPWTTYCSELVCETEQKVNPGFFNGKSHPSPEDIDNWCRAEGWECEEIVV